MVRAAVDANGNLAPWRFGQVHLTRSFKCAGDLDTEIAQYRRARLCRVVVEKNVVAISPQSWLAAKSIAWRARSLKNLQRLMPALTIRLT